MKRKVVWLVVTGWMVAALLLASCAPAVVKEEAEKVAPPVKEREEVVVPKEVVVPEKGEEMVKWTGTKLGGAVVEKMIEKPRHGGVHISAQAAQPDRFDAGPRGGMGVWVATSVQETLLTRDWTRGPGGTGEWEAHKSVYPAIGLEAGMLAESWERPAYDTLIFHIRKGVRYALDPTNEASRLVGGRELTADDVVFSLRRDFEIGFTSTGYPHLSDMKNVANSIYVSPTDKWAVVMKSQPGEGGAALILENSVHGGNKIQPREVIEKYGGTGRWITDWKHVVGTGPFMLKEYVGASALTYVRNPNYWQHDPFFPQNQLPYVDRFKILIIPDLSTRLAAIRTGQIDNVFDLEAEEAESLMKTNPELGWLLYFGGTEGIQVRNDTKPFDDIRVRRALNMAVNNRELTDLYYGGKAVLFAYPVQPVAEFMDMYIPLEKMPQSVRELYEYHPDKARQLLAEAGYPNGFKTEVLVWKAQDVDLLQIVKEYWAKIGVDLKIDVRDSTVFAAMAGRKTYTQMIYTGIVSTSGSTMWKVPSERKGLSTNYGMVDDPFAPMIFELTRENYFDVAKKQDVFKLPLSELLPNIPEAKGLPNWITYANEQSYHIPLPVPYIYIFWQPWLKGYYGAKMQTPFSLYNYSGYIWIDQELKKAMGR